MMQFCQVECALHLQIEPLVVRVAHALRQCWSHVLGFGVDVRRETSHCALQNESAGDGALLEGDVSENLHETSALSRRYVPVFEQWAKERIIGQEPAHLVHPGERNNALQLEKVCKRMIIA